MPKNRPPFARVPSRVLPKPPPQNEDGLTPALRKAITKIQGLFDAIHRGRLERWREMARLITEFGPEGAAEEMRRRGVRCSTASARQHAAAAARLSANDGARIISFRDRRRRMLSGGHVVVLSDLPREAWGRCFELMGERVWPVKELRAWATRRRRRPKLVLV